MSFRISVFFVLWILTIPFYGQKVAFKNYSVVSGLPSSEVYMLYQDSKGYIWFCTDAGVSRYDGYSFKTYTSENGLPDNTIFNLYEDVKGRIWFVGMSKKLSYYDSKDDSIRLITCNDKLVKELANASISSMYVNNQDELYLGINCGTSFFKINPNNNFEKITPVNFKNKGWQINYMDNKQVLWGVIKKKEDESSLQLTINDNQKKETNTKTYNVLSYNTTYSGRYRSFTMAQDGFIFSEDNVVYYKKNDTLIRKELNCSSIICLYTDKENNLWVGTKSHGVYKFKQGDILSNPESYFEKQSVTAVLQDNEGGYWFSTLEHGVYYTPSFIFTYYDKSSGLSGNKIYSILSHDKKIYCFAEDESLNEIKDSSVIINTSVSGIRAYNLGPNQDELFISGSISYFYNPKTKKKRFVAGTDLSSRFFVREAYLAPNGKLYAAHSIGLCEIDIKTASPIILTKDFQFITSVFMQDSILWFGSPDGLFKYTNGKIENLSKRHPLLKNRIDDIIEDKYHRLWFATKGAGILIKKGNRITQLSVKNGLSSNLCRTLLIDSLNTVWVGTNRGISKIIMLNDSAFNIENYSNIHGLLSDEINQISMQGNFIYAAANQGIIKFDKDHLYSNKIPPPIYITDFYVNDNKMPLLSNYTLNYNENFIKVNFLGLSFKNPGNMTYRYRLVGLDTVWKYTKNSTIQYTTLPPGDYQFEIYSMNHDLVHSLDFKSIMFSISKPFWKTIWFILLAISLITFLIYLFLKTRVKRIKKDEAEKTALIKKISEVELKAIRAQMNPHFIFNSINSIQHYILISNTDMAYRYLSKFSKLIRNVLENSIYELISLKKEIETIELYVELEKLRFETKFNHCIYVDRTLDVLFLSISPLLIQPYVENAIWHGLMHKKTMGQLNVYFFDEGELIKCVIEDDGVGRKTSKLIHADNFKKHKSIAISLNQERLDIIGKLFNNKLQVSIFDIEDEEGKACGTRVELFIPKIKFIEHDNSYNS